MVTLFSYFTMPIPTKYHWITGWKGPVEAIWSNPLLAVALSFVTSCICGLTRLPLGVTIRAGVVFHSLTSYLPAHPTFVDTRMCFLGLNPQAGICYIIWASWRPSPAQFPFYLLWQGYYIGQAAQRWKITLNEGLRHHSITAGLGVGMLLGMMEQAFLTMPKPTMRILCGRCDSHYTHCILAERRFYACGHELCRVSWAQRKG